jgi:acyl-CoA thioester hydrolase
MENINLKELKLEDYPLNTFDKVRYVDTDKQGHVNSAGFSTFCETGRTDILFNPNLSVAAEGCTFVIANINLSFIAEINWPGTVDIGTGIIKISNSSVYLGQSLFQDGKLCAISETILVHVTGVPAKSCPIPMESKEFLSAYLITS